MEHLDIFKMSSFSLFEYDFLSSFILASASDITASNRSIAFCGLSHLQIHKKSDD